jgi:CDP-paratose 2-epimerase
VRVLITGACGFVGSTIARELLASGSASRVVGIDSLARSGAETNRLALRRLGVELRHADLRVPSDLESLPAVDVVVDAAASPSVCAGVDGRTSSRQLLEHNLVGTLNVLEYCKRVEAGLIFLSTSRVYSIPPLAGLRVRDADGAYEPDPAGEAFEGLGAEGVSEAFSTEPPLSLYGAAKLASEKVALEYGAAYGFPVCIDRCGVLAGAGQFGRPDQGIFSYWIHSWVQKRPLRYIGFGGTGLQVRDCLHPADLVPLLQQQMRSPSMGRPRVVNVSGGRRSAISLLQLSRWCRERLGEHPVAPDSRERAFDVPWLVLDSSLVRREWDWAPRRSTGEILEEILEHARRNSDWLDRSEDSWVAP